MPNKDRLSEIWSCFLFISYIFKCHMMQNPELIEQLAIPRVWCCFKDIPVYYDLFDKGTCT